MSSPISKNQRAWSLSEGGSSQNPKKKQTQRQSLDHIAFPASTLNSSQPRRPGLEIPLPIPTARTSISHEASKIPPPPPPPRRRGATNSSQPPPPPPPRSPRPSTTTPRRPPRVAQPTPQKWKRGRGFWRAFISICIPLLLSALEGSVTNTALPTISDHLNLGDTFSWVATAFLLSMTAVQPLYGQMADCVGRKIPLILSVIIFAGGSAIAGAAKAPASMILGRVVQGCGTGGIDLFAELILTDIVPLRQRGKYLAWKNSVFALGTLLGPLLGGYFAEHNWRWCFWINLPVSAFALGLILIWLDVDSGKDADSINSVERERKPWDIDFIGAGTITASVSLFLYAFATGGTMVPWGSDKVVIPLVFGIFGTLGFIFWERCSYCKYPMMPPYIFSNRTSATAFALTAVHGFIIYGFQFFLPLYFQAVQGSPPKKSGYQVLPSTVSIVVMAAAGGPLLSRTGKYRGIQQIGFGALAFGLGFFTRLGTHTNMAEWLIIQLIAGFGSGIVVSTMLPAILVKLPDSANGSAAGSWAFLRGIGSLLGVAWPSAVFNLRVSKMLPGIEDAHIRRILDNGHAYQQAASDDLVHASPAVKKQVVDMFQKALRDVWIMFTILAIVAFALTFFERQLEMRKNLDTKFGLRQKPCKRRVGSSEGFIDAGVEKGGLSSGAAAAGSNNTSETSGATTLVDPDLEKQALKESPFEAAGGGDDEIRAVASGSGGRRRIQNHRQPQQHQNRNGDQDEIYGEPEVDSDSDFGAEESEKRGPDEEDGDCGSAARDAKRQSHSSFDEFWHHWRSARRSVGAAGGVVGSSISNAVSNSFLRRGDEGGGGSGPGRGGVRRRVSAAGVV